MSFFKNLFGKKTSPVPRPLAPQVPADPAKDPNMIRVFDAYGREMFITKQAWRDSVLLGHIQKVWNDPEALYSTIVQALQDGFRADVVKAAEHLAAIDPDHERGAVVLAIVYREEKRLDESERVLRKHIDQHGESGVVMTNLAKAFADRGNNEQSLQTLWHGLELDPNQDNGLGWYQVIFREKEGDAAGIAALRRIAALPGSWRARLWLARDALVRKQLEEACALYDEALALAPQPAPTDMLQQISGDLGNHGHLPEALRFTEPHFKIERHGLAVGNNLIKACLDLGHLEAARTLIEQHYALKRMDWKETLAFWDTELAKAQVATASTPSADQKYSVAMLVSDGPIWLPGDSPAAELFPVPLGDPVRVAFLGSTAATEAQGDKPIHQMSNDAGRVSRALPLFLAEQVRFFGACAQVRTFVPWLNGETPAFVLSGLPWSEADAAQQARAGDSPSDYVVITHLNATAEPWQVELRLVRTIDAKCLATANASFAKAYPGTAILQLARDLLQLLAQHADLVPVTLPPPYRIPGGENFTYYFVRLEQLLAVRCSALEQISTHFLSGERDIVDGDLQLCLNQPDNTIARIVLAQTLLYLKKIRPEVVEEFRDKVQLLQKEKPLPGIAQSILQRMVDDIYP